MRFLNSGDNTGVKQTCHAKLFLLYLLLLVCFPQQLWLSLSFCSLLYQDSVFHSVPLSDRNCIQLCLDRILACVPLSCIWNRIFCIVLSSLFPVGVLDFEAFC